VDETDKTPLDQYQVRVWMEGPTEDQEPCYSEEHWFVDRPETDIVVMLLEDAKRTFRMLYPDVEPVDLSVLVTRLRPADNFWPSAFRIADVDADPNSD
jgi:hypothetical protein